MLSIGALSRATGIPVETLRTWERRYRYPEAIRKPSGHRLYPIATAARLRRVQEALERGHRPAQVLPLSEPELDALLGVVDRSSAGGHVTALASPGEPADVRELMQPVAAFDDIRLLRQLEGEWARLGPIRFLQECVAPLLIEIGEAWHAGRIEVRHEHLASERIRDFLRLTRLPFERRARGPRVALATLPDDEHEGGLLMASLIFALAGWRQHYLGLGTPLDQIDRLVRDARVEAVAVSVSRPFPEARRELRALRRLVPHRLPVLAGGSGVDRVEGELPGLLTFDNLFELERWAAERVPPGAGPH